MLDGKSVFGQLVAGVILIPVWIWQKISGKRDDREIV